MAKLPTTPPDELREAAYLLLSEFLPDADDPRMTALFLSRMETVGTAARNLTLAEFASKYGLALKATAHAVDPFTRNWAATQSSALVRQVTETTRRGIAEVIANGIWQQAGPISTGIPVRAELVANDIGRRMGYMAGLDARRIDRVIKFEESLLEAGYSAADAERRARTFAKRQLKDRGETIARTEMRNAVEAGRMEQERRYGAKEKRWHTSDDDDVSEECRQNESDGWIPLDQPFSASGKHSPTEHPNCRCTLETRGGDIEELKAQLKAEGVL